MHIYTYIYINTHYKRAEIKNTKFQKPNWEIVDWIMTNVAEGNMHIMLYYTDHDGIVSAGWSNTGRMCVCVRGEVVFVRVRGDGVVCEAAVLFIVCGR